MYINDVFASFNDLSHKFNLPRSSLFRYFQVRHFLQCHDPNFPNLPLESALDDLLGMPFNPKRLTSRINDWIASLQNPTLENIRAEWIRELGEDLEENIWISALQRVNDSSSCAKLSMIQFKVLHRIHYSKARLAKIYPNTDAGCNRCRSTPANLTHMFWLCPSLMSYWSGIFRTLSEILDVSLQPSAATAIFGVIDGRYPTMRKKHEHIIAFTTLLARRQILLHWKSQNPPKLSLWLSDLMQFIQLEKIKYTLRGSRDEFFSVWNPVLSYLAGLQTMPH